MALTNIYVDPAIAADSGTGTIGNPFGDLEYGIEQTTFDTTNGTQVNIKAGTDEILVAALQLAMANTVTTPAWVTSRTAQVYIRGYTAAANDGGIGGISGNGLVSIFFSTLDYINLIDLHMHNTGNNKQVLIRNYCSVIGCEVNNNLGANGNAIEVGVYSLVKQCYVHNFDVVGIATADVCEITENVVLGTGSTPSAGIYGNGAGNVHRNIIKCEGAMNGINVGNRAIITNNSIWSNGGTGSGITTNGVTNIEVRHMSGNLIEGFSGAGGDGIDLSAAGTTIKSYGANSVYNCTTPYQAAASFTGDAFAANETLTASPFTSGSGSDFSPVNTGAVKEGHLPATFPTI